MGVFILLAGYADTCLHSPDVQAMPYGVIDTEVEPSEVKFNC